MIIINFDVGSRTKSQVSTQIEILKIFKSAKVFLSLIMPSLFRRTGIHSMRTGIQKSSQVNYAAINSGRGKPKEPSKYFQIHKLESL